MSKKKIFRERLLSKNCFAGSLTLIVVFSMIYLMFPGNLFAAEAVQADFTRSSTAYQLNGMQVGSDIPRYEDGDYGQALMIEEGTTNLLTSNQASVETDLSGLSQWSDSGQHLLTRDDTVAWNGTASAKLESNYSGTQYMSISTSATLINISANTTYTASVFTKVSTARQCDITLRWHDTNGNIISSVSSQSQNIYPGSWQNLSIGGTSPANAAKASIHLMISDVSNGDAIWWDGAQLEQKAYATSWQLPGTARTSETLTVATDGVFNQGNWTVEMTFSPTSEQVATNRYGGLLVIWIDGNNYYFIGIKPNGCLYAEVKGEGEYYTINDDDVLTPGNKYSIMFSGNGSDFRLCKNGTQVGGDETYTEPVGNLPANIYIGCNSSGTNQVNGLIDDLRISNRARTLAEHQADYNSGLPLAVDEDTTCKFSFNGTVTSETNNATQLLPINAKMDTPAEALYIDNQITSNDGNAILTQDHKEGKYSVAVNTGNHPSSEYYSFDLTSSSSFDISEYSQIKLWVKPGAGAKWIRFLTGDTPTQILCDNNADGTFEVGQDLESGQWNLVVLDLTKTENSLTQGNGLKVETNENATWSFDNVISVVASVFSFDLNDFLNEKTQISEGALEFIPNGGDTFDVSTTILISDSESNLPTGQISGINIDSGYETVSGPITPLPTSRLFLPGIQPTKYAISGDGNKLFYDNPSDNNYLYRLDLATGVSTKLGNFSATSKIETDYSGSVLYFVDSGDDLCVWNGTKSVINYDNCNIFSVQNDGSLCYFDDDLNKIRFAGESVFDTDSNINSITVAKDQDIIFYIDNEDDDYNLYKIHKSPEGWKRSLLTTVEALYVWTNLDGSLVFCRKNDNNYCYDVTSKALRKLDLTGTVVKVTDENNIISEGFDGEYQLYNLVTDQTVDIIPSDAHYPSVFDVDNAGIKMAYTANGGLSTYYFDGAPTPERYLFSFDGQGSWYSCKDGSWVLVKAGSDPVTADFEQYGMTVEEVNALTEADFAPLYENSREIYSVDAAIYFASIDPYITPSLKSIQVTVDTGRNDSSGFLGHALYAVKQQNFDAATWRKAKRVYPVELMPKEAEYYYFIYGDGLYKSFKNGQWQVIDGLLLGDVESNWIDITLQGMTAEELKNLSETSLTSLIDGLSSKGFSVIYAMKVYDQSTAEYSSLINFDYAADLFDSTSLVLTITLVDGTNITYETGLTAEDVEDFMQWVTERQQNKGPVFYNLKVENTNQFINYYMLQKVTVVEN